MKLRCVIDLPIHPHQPKIRATHSQRNVNKKGWKAMVEEEETSVNIFIRNAREARHPDHIFRRIHFNRLNNSRCKPFFKRLIFEVKKIIHEINSLPNERLATLHDTQLKMFWLRIPALGFAATTNAEFTTQSAGIISTHALGSHLTTRRMPSMTPTPTPIKPTIVLEKPGTGS